MPNHEPPLADRDALDKLTARVRARAPFGVHVFTATGGALALLAMVAAVEAKWGLMFLWLGLALIVDAVDGALARRVNVAEKLPRWSGETLDLVVDFLTYVFVPAFALVAGNLMPRAAAIPAAIVIIVTSALYFADRAMKTGDNYFQGFPAVWNAAVFYLFLLRPDPWITGGAVVFLAVMTFVPMPFLHPFRVGRMRLFNVTLLGAWAALALAAILADMRPDTWVVLGLSAIGLYFFAAGLLRRPA